MLLWIWALQKSRKASSYFCYSPKSNLALAESTTHIPSNRDFQECCNVKDKGLSSFWLSPAQNTWNLESTTSQTCILYSVYSVHPLSSPTEEKMPSLQWCVSFLKQSASGNSTGAQRSFGERSQARDNSSFRGSSSPSHTVGNRKVTGSQDDNVYVSICFLAFNYGCNPLRVWLCCV